MDTNGKNCHIKDATPEAEEKQEQVNRMTEAEIFLHPGTCYTKK